MKNLKNVPFFTKIIILGFAAVMIYTLVTMYFDIST